MANDSRIMHRIREGKSRVAKCSCGANATHRHYYWRMCDNCFENCTCEYCKNKD